jgi:hypothetical protein
MVPAAVGEPVTAPVRLAVVAQKITSWRPVVLLGVIPAAVLAASAAPGLDGPAAIEASPSAATSDDHPLSRAAQWQSVRPHPPVSAPRLPPCYPIALVTPAVPGPVPLPRAAPPLPAVPMPRVAPECLDPGAIGPPPARLQREPGGAAPRPRR